MSKNEEKLLLKFMKTLDVNSRLVIPVEVRKMFGKDYYIEVYKDYAKLIPINKKEK